MRLPPLIADRQLTARGSVQTVIEQAARDISLLDAEEGRELASFSRFLVQSEAVASSKIEYLDAGTEDFARALVGSRANAAASAMVGATVAITQLVTVAGSTGTVRLEDTLEAHRLLLGDDPLDGPFAGAPRTQQNWIGGSDHSPRGALYVPPPPESVPEYLADLYRFANRSDLSAIVQAAVVHAQFESIHPFTDGNGRIGRALINAVLRRRGLTRHAIVPLATALVADRAGYFGMLDAYREGDVDTVILGLASAAIVAADESRVSARRLRELPDEWKTIAPARAGSATATLRDGLLTLPVLTAETASPLVGTSSQAYRALEALEGAGLLREITGRQRNRAWVATDVTDELDDLARRIAERVTGRA